MSTVSSIKIACEPVRSLAFGSISGAYMGIGASFSNPIRILHIQNLTNALLMFSYNGIDDHQALAANSFILLDVTANKSQTTGCYWAEGTRVYVKTIGSPSSGSVYVSAYFGQQ